MSRQLEMRLAREDVDELGERLREDGALFLPAWAPSSAVEPVAILPVALGDGLVAYSTLPDCIDAVERHFVGGVRQAWTIESTANPVLAIFPGIVNLEIHNPGRLHVTSGALARGSSEFDAWTRRVLSRARRAYSRDPELGCYLGPAAVAQIAELRRARAR